MQSRLHCEVGLRKFFLATFQRRLPLKPFKKKPIVNIKETPAIRLNFCLVAKFYFVAKVARNHCCCHQSESKWFSAAIFAVMFKPLLSLDFERIPQNLLKWMLAFISDSTKSRKYFQIDGTRPEIEVRNENNEVNDKFQKKNIRVWKIV